MPPVTVMIKPVSGMCNLNCKYCFYKDEISNRKVSFCGSMLPEVQEEIIQRVLAFAEGSCTIIFQGGEPTLAGLDFYKRVVEIEKKCNIHQAIIHNAIQTNGYVIDDQWAEFFAKNRFLVGISLDGTKELHDLNRVDVTGKGTFSRVMHAIQFLKKYQVDFNILTVVTAATGRNIRKIYGFYDRNNFVFQQYIPCLDPIGREKGCYPYSLSVDRFERFLRGLFDCWFQDVMKGKQLSIQYFDNLLMMMCGEWPEACGMSGICSRQYVIESDGSVYPCDFYMLDKWKLGNVLTESFESIALNSSGLHFIEMSAAVHPDCMRCKWKDLCRGGCRKNRESLTEGKLSKNYYCNAYYNFFEYAYPKLKQVIQFRFGAVQCQ